MIQKFQIKKKLYKHKIFCWIQQNQSQTVKKFYQTFPNFINNIVGINQWTPPMLAARYGNLQLLKYFHQTGHKLDKIFSNHSIIHAACYGNQYQILQYLLLKIKLDPNGNNKNSNTPLKYCILNCYFSLIQLLVQNGAYLIYDNIYIGLTKKDNIYISNRTKKQLSQDCIFKESIILQPKLKQFIKGIFIRKLVMILKSFQTNQIKEEALVYYNILTQKNLLERVKFYCIGN